MELFTPWRTTKDISSHLNHCTLSHLYLYLSQSNMQYCNILIHTFTHLVMRSSSQLKSDSLAIFSCHQSSAPFGFPPLGYFLFFDKDIFLSALQIVLLVSRHHRWGLKLKDWTAALDYPSKKWKFFWNAADRLSSLQRWMMITDPPAAEKWAQDYTGSPSQQEGLGLGAAYLLTDVKRN